MRRIAAIHSRPQDNDCYDQFVEWCVERNLPIRYERWDRFVPHEGETTACFMQDPVGPRKAAVFDRFGYDTLNHPYYMNVGGDRCLAYPIWRKVGILCPDDPMPLDTDTWRVDALNMLRDGPIIVKETGKQMGRSYYVGDSERLDWVLFESARFDRRKFRAIPLLDTRCEDGYYRMYRYAVFGDRAVPTILARTKKWKCKLSQVSPDEFEEYAWEAERFLYSEPPPVVVEAVKRVGLDFALVDTSLTMDGRTIVWELNPYMNLHVDDGGPKDTHLFPQFANFLFDTDKFGWEIPSAEQLIRCKREFRGYGESYWSNRG